MCKEILSLHIGQAGVQTSHALWELICMEHGVGSDGIMRNVNDNNGENIEAMYYEIKNSRYVPRAVLMDLEPTVLDEVRSGAYRKLWNPSNLVNQKEDAASNYARGYYTCGKIFLSLAIERINREIERCDNLSAFEIVHSFAGGTGSGFSSLLSEKLSDTHGKVFKFSLAVFPSPHITEIMVESYNSILHSQKNLEHEDCTVVFDNESLFNKSIEKLKISQPTFSLMNRLISQMFSSLSLSHRYNFFGSQHADVTELLTNLVPYPRIHFPVLSYSPITSYDQQDHELYNCDKLTKDVFQNNNHVLICSLQENKFMSCCMLYRGSITPKPVIDAIAKIKSSREIQFVEWCPTGFKIGINRCPPMHVPHCEQAMGENALCMVSGNTAISQNWSGLLKKFNMLLSKRAFVHWYVSEGLEEGEFVDAQDSIKSLILDYEELNNQNEIELVSDNNPINENNTNNVVDQNLLNINNSVLSNVTNRRFNEIFEHNYNQIYFPDGTEELDLSTSFRIGQVDQKRPTDSEINKNKSNVKSHYEDRGKIQRSIIKYQKVIDANNCMSYPLTKRNRHNTRNLEIKDIQSCVKKYFSNRGLPNETGKISLQSPLKRKTISIEPTKKQLKSQNIPIPIDNDISSQKSIDLMKNNNKDNSSLSSLTKSTETVKNITNKAFTENLNNRKKPFAANQLSYDRIERKIENNLRLSSRSSFSKSYKLSTKDDDSVRLSHSIHSDNRSFSKSNFTKDRILRDNKTNMFIGKSMKPISTKEETKIIEEMRNKPLQFSKIEIVICEPSIYY